MININSVGDYLTIVEKLMKSQSISLEFGRQFVFRGEHDVDYKLLPGILRNTEIINENYKEQLNRTIVEFKNEAKGYLINNPSNDLQWVELAQHHGVLTPLLDWTSNPLVALFFACYEADNKDSITKPGIVHCMNIDKYYKNANWLRSENGRKRIDIAMDYLNGIISHKEPLFYIPEINEERMRVQQSVFAIWGNTNSSLYQIFNGPKYQINVSKYSGIESDFGMLFQLIIPPEQKKKCLLELDLLDINIKTLFPGLDGLGKHFRFLQSS